MKPQIIMHTPKNSKNDKKQIIHTAKNTGLKSQGFKYNIVEKKSENNSPQKQEIISQKKPNIIQPNKNIYNNFQLLGNKEKNNKGKFSANDINYNTKLFNLQNNLTALVREDVYIEDLLLNEGAITSEPTSNTDIVNKLYVDQTSSNDPSNNIVYINPIDGDDSDDGLTPATAFLTLDRALRYNTSNLVINISEGTLSLGVNPTLYGRTNVTVIGSDDNVIVDGLTIASRVTTFTYQTTVVLGAGGPLVNGAHAGQLLKVLTGPIAGRVFSIINNTTTDITLAGSVLINADIVGASVQIYEPSAIINWTSGTFSIDGNKWLFNNVKITGTGNFKSSCFIKTTACIVQNVSGAITLRINTLSSFDFNVGTVLNLTNVGLGTETLDNVGLLLNINHSYFNISGIMNLLVFYNLFFNNSFISFNSFSQIGIFTSLHLNRAKVLSNNNWQMLGSSKTYIQNNSSFEFTSGSLSLTNNSTLGIGLGTNIILRSGVNNSNPMIQLTDNSNISFDNNTSCNLTITNNSTGTVPGGITLLNGCSINCNTPSTQRLTFSGTGGFTNLITCENSNINMGGRLNIESTITGTNFIVISRASNVVFDTIAVESPSVLTGKVLVDLNKLCTLVFGNNFINNSATTLTRIFDARAGSRVNMLTTTASQYVSVSGAFVGDAAGIQVAVSNASIIAGTYFIAFSNITAGGPVGDGSTLIINAN
ncbi:MAG: hypothetical protein KIT69_02750 [Propionibacteriaceae bacterium]|nr:hypothetical protein [Propionibacteriaceae bacterium]